VEVFCLEHVTCLPCAWAFLPGVVGKRVTNGTSATQIDQIRRYGEDSSIVLILFILFVLLEKPDLWEILQFAALVSPHRNCGCSGPKPPADGAPVCHLTRKVRGIDMAADLLSQLHLSQTRECLTCKTVTLMICDRIRLFSPSA